VAAGRSRIIYTLTDEAPYLATHSFLPIVRGFAAAADIDVVESDISVANRILGEFPEFLTEAQRVPDTLAELGRKTLEPDANIIEWRKLAAAHARGLQRPEHIDAPGSVPPPSAPRP